MAIVLPHTLANGTNADAAQVNDNFAALVAAAESIGSAAQGTDVYQAGVVAATDWTPGAGSVNGATGALSFTAFGGSAWLPAVAGGLARTFTAAAMVGALNPPLVPGPSAFVNVGVELTVAGAAATVSVVSGVEKASEAEAIAAPAATSAGKMRIRDVIVKNTAGVYSIVKERDRRPWARGAYFREEGPSAQVVPVAGGATLDMTGLVARVECSGAPVEVTLEALSAQPSGETVIGVTVDGGELHEVGTSVGNAEQAALFGGVYAFSPSAGSHLFKARTFAVGKNGQLEANSGGLLLIRERVVQNANNGSV